MSFRTNVLSFIDNCQQSGDLTANLAQLKTLIGSVGLDRLIIINTWQVGDTILPGIPATTMEMGVLHTYAEGRWHLCDPIWHKAETAGRAYRWNDVWAAEEKPQRPELRALYEESRIADGLTVPVFDQRFRKSLVSLLADRPLKMQEDDVAMLTLAVIVFRRSAAARALDEPVPISRGPLTAREREILRWTAAGKSAWEISTILSLSEATVARHLLNIRGKLRASNTVQAVAEAIRSQEIVL